MQALIIDKEADRLDNSLIALMKAGIHVTGTSSLRVAEICITRMCVDLLVLDKSALGDALGDTIGMAEECNPLLVSVLRTPDVERDQNELTPFFKSLHCVVGQEVPNNVAVKLGLASLRGQLGFVAAKHSAMPLPRRRVLGPQVPLTKRAFQPPTPMAEAV